MSTTDNALREFLEKREPELASAIKKLRAELGPLERELAEVRRAKATLGMKHGNALADALVANLPQAVANSPSPMLLALDNLQHDSSYANLTIKQLLFQALHDHFTDGATPSQLREFIRDAYGRDIERSSLSPQLSRLCEEGIVLQPLGMLDEGKYRLKLDGIIQNALDTSAENKPKSVKHKWYEHPGSKK